MERRWHKSCPVSVVEVDAGAKRRRASRFAARGGGSSAKIWFSGRRWERKGSFNVYIFTFGRSVEFVRFVLMMTGAKTRPVDVARYGVTKRASSRALRAYECGSCLRTVPCLRRAAQIGCRSPRRSTTWSPKARRGWFLMVFAPKNPAGQSRECRWSTCTFYIREVMSIAGIVRAHKPARRGEGFVAGSETVPGSCAEP